MSRLCSILIPAVGGQGGGVLAEWLVEAGLEAGLASHGTSIPGVAQRTGSTTYYVEVFEGPSEAAPAFSLYPIPGALDVLLAPEFMEVGRAIEAGFPSPERTTIVASTHRLYSIHEKMPTGRGLYPQADLEAAARAFSRRLVAFDALAVAREHGTEVNAVLLGALAATEALPIPPDAYRAAIRRRGVAVEENLRGFDVGLALVRGLERPDQPATDGISTQIRSPATVVGAGAVEASVSPPAGFAEALAAFPEGLRPLLAAALARLVDYQDERYARRYLERLEPFRARGDEALLRAVARPLAVWMTYEDAVRVADLKTRRSRFERIRAEVRAGEAEIEVVDYLKPDLDELYGILPHRLVAPLARWAERRWPHGRPTVGQHVKTTTVLGFLRLRLLAALRRWRPISYRARREHERMGRWLDAVRRCADWDRDLAVEVAQAAQLVKGYGEVRRRLIARFDDLLERVLTAGALEAAAGRGFAVTRELAATCRRLVLEGPDHEPRAAALAAEVVRHLQQNDPEAATAVLKTA
ncbi:MAG TPA: indolepyruvate oxidoreductase subunit beta family protein [Candidatus Binatia bacterium]|nr:indolepyruvate oxidoreductase subunit beta family protein [Candidatus Binatia bacterium]